MSRDRGYGRNCRKPPETVMYISYVTICNHKKFAELGVTKSLLCNSTSTGGGYLTTTMCGVGAISSVKKTTLKKTDFRGIGTRRIVKIICYNKKLWVEVTHRTQSKSTQHLLIQTRKPQRTHCLPRIRSLVNSRAHYGLTFVDYDISP